jgi:hypothetical protein
VFVVELLVLDPLFWLADAPLLLPSTVTGAFTFRGALTAAEPEELAVPT